MSRARASTARMFYVQYMERVDKLSRWYYINKSLAFSAPEEALAKIVELKLAGKPAHSIHIRQEGTRRATSITVEELIKLVENSK